MSAPSVGQRLVELRDTFDRAFAEPTNSDVVELEDLLAIRVAGDPYAIRLAAIKGLAADPTLTALPGAPPRLLGVAVVRRTFVPVYDLAVILGYPGPVAARWLVLARGEPTVALSFDRVDGHMRLPRDAVAREAGVDADGPSGRRRSLAGEVVATSTGARAVIDIPAVHAVLVAAARSDHQGGGR